MAEDAAQTLRDAAKRLDVIADDLSEESDRQDLDDVIADLRIIAVRSFGPKRQARRGEGGKGKVLAHLMDHLGEWVHGEELAAVSGIGSWARRKREWTREEGYDIDERDGYYRLNSIDPNEEVAKEWRIPNEIRRREGSGGSRILALLKEYEGQVVEGDKLRYVARIPSYRRRTGELRDEQGWPIETHVDAPDLKPGQYRLVSTDQKDRRDPRQRHYPEGLRERVFQRDSYTCQKCGRNRESAEKAGDPRFYLEIHHKKALADEVDALPPEELNDEGNLITYCHHDHIEETRKLHKQRREERSKG